jgi:exodeoxyribonuclease VII small subunit
MEARMQESAHHPARPARPDVAGLSFEEALAELEGIVKALESGQGSLEKAIEDYERGAALRRHCERKLAEAEQKVQAIVETPNGPSLREVE